MIEDYLGDGVYATFDGTQIWLDCRAQSGLAPAPSGSPGIALEESTLRQLDRFRKRVEQELTAGTQH